MSTDKQKIELVEPRDLYFDEEATAAWPRWWHKLVFWKEYKYPRTIVQRKWVTRKQLKENLERNK